MVVHQSRVSSLPLLSSLFLASIYVGLHRESQSGIVQIRLTTYSCLARAICKSLRIRCSNKLIHVMTYKLFFPQGLSLTKLTKDLMSYFNPAVMAMRAYAFSGRDRRVLIPLATCYLGLLAVNIWVFCIHIEAIPESFYILIGGTGCFPNYGDQIMVEKIGVSI